MVGAQHLGQLSGIGPAERFAEIAHQAFEMIEVSLATSADGALILAGMGPLAIDAMVLHQPLQLRNRGTVERQQTLFVRRVRMLQGKFVRQVDHKTGVAPRGAMGDPLRIHQQDTGLRMMLGQTAGSGEAGETRANHGVVCTLFTGQALAGRLLGQRRVPAAARVIEWQVDRVFHDSSLRQPPAGNADRTAAMRCVAFALDDRAGQNH
ncbi:hypothetical protein D3C86_548670 [compost metagenome]